MKSLSQKMWSAKQKQYPMWLADPTCRLSDTKIAEELGITRLTLYNWRQEPGFIAEAYSQLDKNIHARLNKVFNGLLDKAEKGDERAARLIFEVMGKLDRNMGMSMGGSHNKFFIQVVEKNKEVVPIEIVDKKVLESEQKEPKNTQNDKKNDNIGIKTDINT